MSFKIVRNDITKMNTEAIVNTANTHVSVGTGCDSAVYRAAGYDELLQYRREKIGEVSEGEVFLTPGFGLQAEYIIHAVSPYFMDGDHGEEEKLRSCYRKSLQLAKENGINSIAFPLIATGGFGYPKEEGMRIAVDEIHAFLLENHMEITLVVFDKRAAELGERIYPELEAYIDRNYVNKLEEEEYGDRYYGSEEPNDEPDYNIFRRNERLTESGFMRDNRNRRPLMKASMEVPVAPAEQACESCVRSEEEEYTALDRKLKERLSHKSDTFSEYLLHLIESKGMNQVNVYKKAIIDKRYFAKIRKNKDFHPEKIKALCLCVGAELNLDETKDLLARAGYALSPADMTDIIFSFYIEQKHYDVIDIDIRLEEYGLPCIIS